MKKLLIAAAMVAFATPALAATDGNLSETSSTGSLDVTVSIPKMVRVSGLQDMTFNISPSMLTEPYFSREDQTDKFCVYSNDGQDGQYSMTVTSSNPGDAHHHWGLTGAGGTLPFSMWTSDTTNQFKTFNFGQTVTYATNGDGQGRRTTLNCSDHGTDASIKVGFDDSDLLAAQAGTYSGTVTVTVSTI